MRQSRIRQLVAVDIVKVERVQLGQLCRKWMISVARMSLWPRMHTGDKAERTFNNWATKIALFRQIDRVNMFNFGDKIDRDKSAFDFVGSV